MSKTELIAAGITQPDFILVSGDAYVDHPAFGAAIIGRTLQAHGYTVGIIAQPSWKNAEPFRALGKPKLAFLVTSGNLDSMVSHYAVTKHRRSKDVYSPGDQIGCRPDRAAIVYANRCKEAYKGVPVVLGGLEASLRRFAHYDYWEDAVRHSILLDSGADLLLYGMAERAMLDTAEALAAGLSVKDITYIAGTAFYTSSLDTIYDYDIIESYTEVAANKQAYARAFLRQYQEQDAVSGRRLVQAHEKGYVVVNPPAQPLTQQELDAVYDLPYTRKPHPSYKAHISALDEVEFSLTSCRGCFGGCAFCALTFHQGRVVQARSHRSLLQEAKRLTELRNFKGYIHDVGGPTANFRQPACEKQKKSGTCKNMQCIGYQRCDRLQADHSDYIALLRKLRTLPNVKKVFVRSGIRFDYVMYDKSKAFLRELAQHHISGQLKVAPEHVDDRVLQYMNKPPHALYERFVQRYEAINRELGKQQFIVPYFISSHPGSDIHAAIALAEYLKAGGQRPEQVQDFYPTPGTLATCMYHTGLDPRTMEMVYVAKGQREKSLQRALMQYFLPQNYAKVREALRLANREDLIGFGKSAFVPPERERVAAKAAKSTSQSARRSTDAKQRANNGNKQKAKPPRNTRKP